MYTYTHTVHCSVGSGKNKVQAPSRQALGEAPQFRTHTLAQEGPLTKSGPICSLGSRGDWGEETNFRSHLRANPSPPTFQEGAAININGPRMLIPTRKVPPCRSWGKAGLPPHPLLAEGEQITILGSLWAMDEFLSYSHFDSTPTFPALSPGLDLLWGGKRLGTVVTNIVLERSSGIRFQL